MRLNILMVIAMLTWGLSWTNAKILGQYADAPLIMVTGSFCFFVLCAFPKANKRFFTINKKNIYFILGNALCMVSYNYFYFKGTDQTCWRWRCSCLTLNPIPAGTIWFYHAKEGLDWPWAGTHRWCIYYQNMGNGYIPNGPIRKFFFISTSLSWVCVTIITSRSKDTIPFMAYSFWSFTFACLLSIPISMNEDL